MKVELLAPAKNLETGICAINYGADAVYIGATSFGARNNAKNNIEDIKKLVEYAHKFYVKIYVTINTILNDEEIIEAQKLIQKLYEIGVDAIIIQDMGLLEIDLPPINIHASTQCDNRDLEKILFFEKTGIKRVILARELSKEKIKEICEKTNIEIETFIHGALCVSYSGQCYLSQSIGKRSANRGECAQPCRKKYSLLTDKDEYLVKDKYLLCLKDFSAQNEIKNLIDVGVNSFKIEGRLKDINYVKNVVGFYRKLIDKYVGKTSSGKVFFDFEPDINKVFNRGFTDYFLNGRKQCFNFNTPKFRGEQVGKIIKLYKNYFIYEGIKLNIQDGLTYFKDNELKGFLVNKIDGNKVYPNLMKDLTENCELYRNFDANFNKLVKISKTKRQIGVEFTIYDNYIEVIDEDNNKVKLNFEQFEIAKNPEKAQKTLCEQLSKTGETDFYVQNIVNKQKNIYFIPISKINEIRRNILELLMNERLKNYQKITANDIKVLPYYKKELDYRANILNLYAENFYKKRGANIKEVAFEKTQTKNVELMRTKHCIKYALNMCKSKEQLYLEDECKHRYKLEFDCKNCEMIIKNKN